ncbi:LIC_10190 family membrane protein [Larkinella sp. VNQ87]|uniref:LIC_10190 family membrane protein n=1 Tax=Larkinella sp. VNQ87 TaxID=3400921 RepID=UPI003C072F60
MILLLLWAVLAVSCLAYGLGLNNLLSRWRLVDSAEPARGSDLSLLGLVQLVMFVQLTSIFRPANYELALVWLAGAAFLLFGARKTVRPYLRRFLRQKKQMPVFGLMVLTVLLYSLLEPANVDSGMYHLPSIRWYERFRVIPGLGNLHGRLAFNPSFFVTSAAFGFTDWAGQTLFPLNGFVFLVVCWRLLSLIRSVKPYRFLALVMLMLLFFYLIRQVFSPTPDVWATLFGLTIFFAWLDLPSGFTIRHVLIFLLVCLCLTIKLATIPLGLCLLPIGWSVWQRLTLRHGIMLGVMGLLVVVPWLVRTTILSGYLVYPFPALDLFSFDWEIPNERVQFEKDFVGFWAKFRILEPYYNPELLKTPVWQWVPRWLQHQEYYALNKPIWYLAAFSPLVALGHWWQADRRKRFQPWLVPWLVALAGFLFWFLSAPEFRFGYSFIWMTAFLPWLPFIPPKTAYWNLVPWSHAILIGLLAVLLIYFGYHYVGQERFPLQTHWLLPQPLTYRSRGTEKAVFVQNRTQSGLLVLTPAHAPILQSCFDQEKPCSPYFYPDLELRGKTIADGFRSARRNE